MAEGICWPNTDYLFESGVKELISRTGSDDFFFINLNDISLCSFLVEMPISTERKNVIICSDNLISLANYLYDKRKCIFAVFKSNIRIECLAYELKGFNTFKRRLRASSSQPILSRNEFNILQLMAKGMDVKHIAFEKGFKKSTVYKYSKIVSDKLNFCHIGQPFQKTFF